MNAVTVTPVYDRAATTAFVRLPYALHRDDPYWVAPLEREMRAFLDPRRNPFFDTAEARLFLARRGRRTVGRIAAVADPRFQERHDFTCGHFGLFECADDLEAAGALFDAAAAWLAGRGLTRMLGPLSFSVNDECGVLVDGFDGPPSVGIPYNPPYYADLLTGCGFGKAKDLLSWLVPMPPDGEPPAAIARVAARTLADPAVRVRPLDRDRYEDDMAAIRDIYNDAWAENYASVPLTDAEFLHMAAQLKSVVHPELVRIAEVDGEPAAFTLWVPDVNQALRAARGRLTTWGLPIGMLRISRAMGRITRVRGGTSGVRKEHRSRGLVAVLLADAQRAAFRLGYTETDLSWILEDNRGSNRHAQAMGGVHFRTHRLFEREGGGLR
ncbi:N-acetyltransferase [Actinacidiphila glaucinigra]|uniref:GNAT family N-acetyltransferase n=1 Tax=Actinacidiphila glaucinigra TaxID=235986 RepID=UPI002DD996EF|nr:N-acetyltransferase [Actinacidiphila glaucinigra]WSD59541.1 N-acetyltransferase [Actinacidiphila glaucinigra]